MSRIVIALGGNALGDSPQKQKEIVKETAKYIVPIIKDGDALGSIIILACENKCFDDSSVKICKAFAKYLSDQIS